MRPLANKYQLQIALWCHAAVLIDAAAMHNPKYRGAKFSWQGFIERMERYCSTGVHLNVLCPEKLHDQVSAHAGKLGREIATRYVKEMGDEPVG